MTAEPIAELVADIRAGRVEHPAAFDMAGRRISSFYLDRAQFPQPVVDCTAIYDAYIAANRGVSLYDDHPSIMPPWTDSMLAFVNQYGNVCVLQVHRNDWDGSTPDPADWFTENTVDWPRVRWVAETAIWIGGRSRGRAIPTSGPCHLLRHAIHEDGSLADINWVALLGRRGERSEVSTLDLDEAQKGAWETATVMVGASLNFLGASNVEVAEPLRPRPVRRRLARTGVTVQTIVVRPPGRRRAVSSEPRPIEAGEQVFSPVRGHWARYGVDGREGLLFGKYRGKYWVPAHVRGEGDESRDYVLRPGGAA